MLFLFLPLLSLLCFLLLYRLRLRDFLLPYRQTHSAENNNDETPALLPRISILIPCHRVVGTNGKLTGYAGGLDKKEWLLRHEGWL